MAPASTNYYQAILHQLPHAFCVGEVVFDELGTAVDYRLVEVNAAFEQQSTLRNAVGRTLRELAPAPESTWYERLGQVVRTGQAAHFEQQNPFGRGYWYEVQALPTGPPGSHQVALLLTDSSARRQTEAALRSSQDRQAFLVQLGDELRPLPEATQVQEAAARLLGQYLRANQVHYGETQGDDVVISQGYGNGLPAMTGRFRSVDFGEKLTATHRAGIVQVVSDTETEAANTEAERQVLRQARIGAYITVPLLKQGQWVATLAVHCLTPRAWTVDEVRLVEDVAERTWAAVERARAEKALRESEAKYRAIFNSINEGFSLLDIQFDAQGEAEDIIIRDANPAQDRIDGVRALIGQRVREMLPNFELKWVQRYARVVQSGEPAHFEDWSAATQRWYEVDASRVGEAGSTLVAIVYNDITERKQAKMALEKAHERLQLAMDVGRIFSFEMNPATRALDLSENVDLVMGFPLPDHIDSTFELIHPDDLQPTVDLINGAIDSRGSYASEYRLVNPANGEVVWFHSQAAFIQHTAGGEWRFVGIAQNITERKRAAEALRESEEKYRTLFNSIDEGYYLLEVLFDERGAVTDVLFLEANPAAIRLSGGARRGKSLRELSTYEAHWYELCGRVARTGVSERTEQFSAMAGIWVDSYTFKVGEAGNRVAAVFQDVTARKRREANQAFLADLTNEFTRSATVDDIMQSVSAKIGAYLKVVAVVFNDVDEARGQITVSHGWMQTGVLSLAGNSYRFEEYLTPEFQRLAHAGELFVVRDTQTDPRTDAALYAARQIQAWVVVPFHHAGEWQHCLTAYDAQARDWREDEIELFRELASHIFPRLERARAEEDLRASEALLQKAFAIDTVGVLFFTAEGRMTNANPAFARLSGYSREQLLALPTSVLTPPEFADVTARAIGEVAERGETAPYEKQVLRPDGSRWWALCAPTRLRGEGTTAECVEFIIDISERKQAEEQLRVLLASLEQQVAERTQALQASHERLHTIFEAVPLQLGYYEAVRDDQGQLVDLRAVTVNQASVNQMELLDNTPGQLMSVQLPGLQALPVWHTMTQVIDTGQPQRLELHHAFGARTVWFDVLYTRLGDGLISASLDITSRKQMEQEVRQGHDLLQSIFDTSLIGMAVQEAVRDASGDIEDFRLVFVNRELERTTGRTDLVGKYYAQEYPGIKANGLFELMRATVEDGEPQQMEYYYPYEGFKRWFSSMFVKLNDGVVASTLDITKRKQAEEEQLRNFTLLQQSEEVASLGSWDYDRSTGAFQWSAGMYQLFELAPDCPIQPATYLDFAIPEDRPVAERIVQGLREGHTNFEETLRIQVGEAVKTLRVKAAVVLDAAGEPLRVLGVDLDISEVQRLEADNLRLRLTQQQALFEAVQQAQETERKRIAEGLHNGIGQLLYATKLRLDMLHAPVLNAEPALAAARHEAERLLADAIRQTRVLSHELVPTTLEEFGLAAALEDICRQLSTPQLPLSCHVLLDGDLPPLPLLLQLALYRMAQELGLNMVKHAHGATEASLELETMPGFVLLRAEDNGAGFTPDLTTSAGLGLRTIRDRVALLNGTLDLGHRAGFGTFVRLRIPLPAAPTV